VRWENPIYRGFSLFITHVWGAGYGVNALDGVSLHVDTGEFVQRLHQCRKQHIRMFLLEHYRRTDF